MIPSNDFSFYDQVLDHAVMFGAIPERYRVLLNKNSDEPQQDLMNVYFAMARGLQKAEEGLDLPAMEMKKVKIIIQTSIQTYPTICLVV